MNVNSFLWISAAIMFLLAEVGHPGLFFFLPFACGAAASALIAVWTESIIWQGITFLLVTGCAFIVIHYWLQLRKSVHEQHQTTNIDALVGKQALVIQAIEQNGTGYVKISGEQWLARSIDNQHIEKNVEVEVVATRGAHVIVKKISSNS